MQSKSFLKSSAILFSGEFVTRFLGFIYISFLYKINPIVSDINAAIMIPYGFILIVTTFGLGTALNQQLSTNLYNSKKYSRTLLDGLIFAVGSSFVMMIIVFIFGGDLISQAYHQIYFTQYVRALNILAISIVFFAINLLLKAVFISKDDLKVVSFTYVSEQIIKIAIILIAAILINKYELENKYLIYMFAFSVTFSVFTTTFIMLMYIFRKKLLKGSLFIKKYKFNIKRMFIIVSIGFIFFLNSLFISGFSYFDSLTFGFMFDDLPPHIQKNLSSLYFTNVFKLINLPIALGGTFLTIMTRQISITKEEHKFKTFNKIFDIIIFYGMLAFVFFVSAGIIFYIIFWSYDLVGMTLLAQTAILIPIYLFRMIISVYAILRDKIKETTISIVILFVLKLILNFAFIPIFDIVGFNLATIVSVLISTMYLILSCSDVFQFNIKDVFIKIVTILKFMLFALGMYLLTIYFLKVNNFPTFIQFIISSITLLIFFVIIFYWDIRKMLQKMKKE